MDKREFSMFASGLRTYYPRENILPNDQAMELWFQQLQDLPFKVAEAALHKWVATNKWSPSIADIRETAAEIMNGELQDWGEGWRQVMRAISNFGSYDPDGAIDTLDEISAIAVRRIGWLNLCMSENIEIERANFRMIYEAEAKRKKRDAQIPPRVARLTAGMQLKRIDDVIRGEGDECRS